MKRPTHCLLCFERIERRWWHVFVAPLPLCPRPLQMRCTRIQVFGRMAR